MEPTPVHNLNISAVLSVSKKIILANYSHLITLSLFFLPLSILLNISPTLQYSNHQNLINISYLFCILIIYILTLCAICTITYTTHHAFFESPVKLSDSLKSLTSSFFPLASTAIIAHVLIILISLSFLLFVGILLMLVHKLGFVIDYNSTYFLCFSTVVIVILIAIIIYFYVEWSLAFVVAVVESKWGFTPLIRSSYLVKGKRSVSLLVMLYFGVCSAIFVQISSTNPHAVVIMMLGSFFVNMMLIRLTAANTVLYNYCRALHGELAIEGDGGLVHDYVNLPTDDRDGFERESMSFPP